MKKTRSHSNWKKSPMKSDKKKNGKNGDNMIRICKTKYLRSVMVFRIIVVVSLIIAYSSTIASGNGLQQMFQMSNRVDIQWNSSETQDPIIPRDKIKILNLSVFYTVDVGDYFAKGFYDFWKNHYNKKGVHTTIKIQLDIIDSSPWCSAALKSNIVYVNFSKNQTTTATIYIILNEDAPAYGSGYISLNATAKGVVGTPLKPYKNTFTLSFTPTYIPYINVNLSKINTVEVTPMEKAVFAITIENLGNARTKVFLEVKNLPESWQGVVTNEITLGETLGSSNTAYLTVQPPKNFGFHNEKEIIRVALTPVRAENISDRGDTTFVTFLVKSKGVGTPGFDSGIILPAFVFVCIGFYLRKTKKKQY